MRIDTDMEIQIQRIVDIAINRYKDMDIEIQIYMRYTDTYQWK